MSENMACSECGANVIPADAFHPWLYCLLFKWGIDNPAAFMESQHFIPDPAFWGEEAPVRQSAAAERRRVVRSEVSA